MTRAVLACAVLLAVWRLGVWAGATEERQSRDAVACLPNTNRPEVGRIINPATLMRMPQ